MAKNNKESSVDASLETMSKEKQVKNTLLYLGPAIVSNALPIISLPIILRNLSTQEYGAYALSLACALFILSICHFALGGVYERNFFVYKGDRESSQLLYTTLMFVFSMTLLAGFITYIFRVQFAEWIIHSGEYGNLLFCTFCAQGIFNLKAYFVIYLKNMGRAKPFVVYTIMESFVSVCFSLYFVALLKLGPLGIPLGTLIGSTSVFLVLTLSFLKRVPFRLNRTCLISSLKLSLPLMSTRVVGAAGKHFDKYIIGVLSSVGGTGVYAIGQKVANLAFIYMTALQNVYGPMVYHKMFTLGPNGGKEIGRYLTPFAYVSVASGLFISLASEDIVRLLAPATYQNADAIVNLLCISFVISFFAKQPQLMYAGKTIIQSVLTIVNFVFTVVLLYVFVNNFGVIGAAIGTIIVNVIYIYLLLWQGQKYYRIIYEIPKLSLIFGTFIVMSISVFLFREWGLAYGIRLTIKIAYFALFVELGVLFGILTKDNLNIFLGKSWKNRNIVTYISSKFIRRLRLINNLMLKKKDPNSR